jgi:hypothetical protein
MWPQLFLDHDLWYVQDFTVCSMLLKTTLSKSLRLNQGSKKTLLCKGSHNKYFKIFRPYGFFSAILTQRQIHNRQKNGDGLVWQFIVYTIRESVIYHYKGTIIHPGIFIYRSCT